MALGRKFPNVRSPLTQCEHGRGPGLAPAGFERPCAPADVGGTGPRFPELVIEGAEPRAVQIGELLRSGLDSAEKLDKLVFSALQIRITRRTHRFVETEQRETGRVKLIAHRVAVVL